MIHVDVHRRIPASRQRVWDIYTDWEGWTSWAKLGRVRLARTGDDERNGVGAVRAIDNFGYVIEEEIIAFEPNELVRYRVVGGPIPMRDHEGEVLMAEESGGTRVTWRCRFRPTLPGIGPIMKRVVAGVFRHVLKRLDRQLSR